MTEIRNIVCPRCGAEMIPGPCGGAAQNYYCTNRVSCRRGENLTIWRGEIVFAQPIGEVADETFAMYYAATERVRAISDQLGALLGLPPRRRRD